MSTDEVLVGVDLGTTGTKAVLTSPDGETLAFAQSATLWTTTGEGRQESTGRAMTEGVLRAVTAALADLAERTGRRPGVAALGIAGLAESGAVLDAHGEEVSPVMAWFDDRGTQQLRELPDELRAELPRRTGLPLGPQPTFAKLLWLRDKGFRLTPASRWLTVPELVAWHLTGVQAAEPSLASRTGLLDQATGTPWPEALAAVGAPSGFLPPLVPAGTAIGRVRGTGADQLDGALLTVAGHDHPVAAVGVGATNADDLLDSCGTAEVLLRSVPRLLDDDERATLVRHGIEVGRHVLAGQSALLGSLRTGLLLSQVVSLEGADAREARDALDRRWSPTVRAGAASAQDDAWAAALSQTAHEAATLLVRMQEVVGDHASAVAAGGWTRLRSVRETRTAVVPRLRFSPIREPGARGAALLAACAATGRPAVDVLPGLAAARDE